MAQSCKKSGLVGSNALLYIPGKITTATMSANATHPHVMEARSQWCGIVFRNCSNGGCTRIPTNSAMYCGSQGAGFAPSVVIARAPPGRVSDARSKYRMIDLMFIFVSICEFENQLLLDLFP